MRLCSLVLAATVLAWAVPQRRDREPDLDNPLEKNRAAIEPGRELFASSCGACHGPTGQGGRGPNLADGRLVRGASNRRLFDSIRKGVPGTEMPPYTLPDEKIWQIVTFLRDLSASAFDTEVPGDAAAGKALFFGKARCSDCHMIRGQGGLLGPDLANIGNQRSPAKLREALLKPGKLVEPGYRTVRVVLSDGSKLEGVARNSSNYALQMIDRQGRLHLLERRQWREVQWPEGSLMPNDYQTKLTAQELQDLLAFLSRQSTGAPAKRGRRPE